MHELATMIAVGLAPAFLVQSAPLREMLVVVCQMQGKYASAEYFMGND